MNATERKWFSAVASLESCVLCHAYGIQVAHSNENRGMGQKSAPWLTAALCRNCHHEIDNGKNLDQHERRSMMRRAILLTHDALIRSGKLRIV